MAGNPNLALWLSDSPPVGYRRLYYFTAPDFALQNLRASQLKISSFDACNDFYELRGIDLSDKKIRRQHEKWCAEVGGKLGLICFSKCWKSPIMWGHYTNRGSGICLVCDVEIEHVKDIIYRREIGDASDAQATESLLELDDISSVKSRCVEKSDLWEYEKEVRYFVGIPDSSEDSSLEVVKSGMWFHKFGGAIKLRGIINGPRPSLGKAAIMDACGDKTLEFFQCRPAFGDFRMTPQLNTKLWKP